jgi:Tol biopolymer transport system component
MTRKKSNGISRRRLLSSAGGLAAAALGGVGIAPEALPAAARPGNAKPMGSAASGADPQATHPEILGTAVERYVTVTEGTNIAAAVSPDGKTIAFDLFGGLWLVGVTGGPAHRLTGDFDEVAQPDWAPDGRSLVFQSYRDGNFHLWSIRADGTGLTQLTTGPYDCREPRYSPDGRRIAYSSDATGGRYAVHVLELASGESRVLTASTAQECEPAWSPDGKSIALVAGGTTLQIVAEHGDTKVGASVPSSSDPMQKSELHAPSWLPDGKGLVYVQLGGGASQLMRDGKALTADEDVFPMRATWLSRDELLYTSSGKLRRRSLATGETSTIAFSATVPVVTPSYARRTRDFDSPVPRQVKGIGSPVLSPDGKHIAFRALNDLYTMKIGEAPVALLRDRFYKCDPSWSADGRTLAYSSDRGGTADIWLRDMAHGTDRQLTKLPFAAVSCTWSPDGADIAFLDQMGALHTVEVASGAVHKVFDSLWEPGRPTWSPDGRFLALAAFKPYSPRYREGLSEILVIERATGAATYAPVLPNRSLGTRGDDGPVWSPDGTRMAFVFASTLWVVTVDGAGRMTAAPKQITHETTDAPSWSGDSKSLLYLSSGKLRLVSASGGAPRDIALDLQWRNAAPVGRTIIRAGRMWDGVSPEYRSRVDVIVERNRIVAILPAAAKAPSDANARFVDASVQTLMPGLVDMHTHRQMQGYSYGDRQGRLWLAMGVTSTRSPGAPAYHMVEDREATDSGARTGPRHFATGEAIDGSRIFYNFMRPVTEPGQMELELQRAEALSYDMVKTYVRLSPEQQKRVIDWAHGVGIHVSSHYHFPSLRFGIDCMEHLGATNRLGYSRTVSALGAAYEDVDALFVQSHAGRTPTLFTSTALLGEDRSLVEDIRIRTLYPRWEYARLLDRARQMAQANREPLLASLERNVAHVKRMLRNGARVLSGTDAPIDFVAVSLHMNLRAMVKYGLSPYEALVTATRFPGEFLGEPLGTIAPGAFADLLLLDGDPLARIQDVAEVQSVMKNGELFTVQELMKPFASGSSSSRRMSSHLATRSAGAGKFWWHEPDYVESSRGACCANHFSTGLS